MRQEARIPSNRMPQFVPERVGIVGWVILAFLGTGIGYLCSYDPGVFAVLLIIAAAGCAGTVAIKHRQRRIAAERRGESICTFARSFNCRATDTWVVRAVFEELAAHTEFPIRADDRLEADLSICSEELDEVAQAIAQRTGRPLESCEANPIYGKVETVRNLVEFFVHQARRNAPAA